LTGGTGEAGAGLQVLNGLQTDDIEAGDRLIRRFLYPDPRVEEGKIIVDIATAMIDISDGLHTDVRKLLRASGVGAELETGEVPLSPDLLACVSPQKALDLALTAGDDYELCFTVPPEKESMLEPLIARSECPITRIGETRSKRDVLWMRGGRPYPVPEISFRHF
jgi:thiamine-monophosphate kinase